jgi:hypothetical protein
MVPAYRLILLLRGTVAAGSACLVVMSVAPAFGGASDGGAGKSGPLDAGATRPCSITARGGVIAHAACSLQERSTASDGGEIGTVVQIQAQPVATSPDLRMDVTLLFVGRPSVGFQAEWPGGTIVYAKAHVVEHQIEWEASARVQGAFTVSLTSVRVIRASGAISYEVHGTLEADLPYSNLPLGDPTKPVALQVSF